MKARLHHIEMCISDPERVLRILRDEYGFRVTGQRDTPTCEQTVLETGRTVFVITSRKLCSNDNFLDAPEESEPWTVFCCAKRNPGSPHIDSVFNVAIEVEDLSEALDRFRVMKCETIRGPTVVTSEKGSVSYAIIESCCGNVVHTVIQKSDYGGWFLPQYQHVLQDPHLQSTINPDASAHFDHVALACHVGETESVIEWYEKAFEMKRFITNRQDTEARGLVIDGEVGMRLKVMEFWKCSESGLGTDSSDSLSGEPLKIVVVECLPDTANTQVANFLRDHQGPGLQHLGLHTSNMVETVKHMVKNGARFRQPPPTYYTPVGQLEVIKSVGEDITELQAYGILLDDEADVFDDATAGSRYLMQIFSHPIFERDTFFLEVIQRKGARGFGVGNVTALARSVTAYNELIASQQKNESLIIPGSYLQLMT